MNEKNKETNTLTDEVEDANEERALSVFSSERNEDMTALILCLVTTFMVLLFTKWLV